MRTYHLNLLVLSAGLLVLLAKSGTTAPQADEDVQQLTLQDVNQAEEQQEMPAVRLARQFGFGRGGFGRREFGGFCCGGGGFRRPGFGGFGGFYPRPPPPPFFGGPFFG
ncbi:uncharacterized protein LOC6553548 [Drosophila erecta]|uniref:GG17039 n=1 Tax=Drosophila erecta TaxID=7220 RepID=B3P433_DROER|nr:uncharacterized protein LOC6553548 [Drosophila erecta]EDV49207.1 uncharacterized protein Dere_GG17039 [Drosophila erecta]